METGAIAAIFGVIALLLKAYFSGKPERDERKEADAQAQGRKDIVDGNVDAVSARIDGLFEEDNSGAGRKNGKTDGK